MVKKSLPQLYLKEIDEGDEVNNWIAQSEARKNPEHNKHNSNVMQYRRLPYIHLQSSLNQIPMPKY